MRIIGRILGAVMLLAALLAAGLAAWFLPSIRGEVRDPNGKPLADVRVVAVRFTGEDDMPTRTARTGPDGRYTIRFLLPGRYIVVSESAEITAGYGGEQEMTWDQSATVAIKAGGPGAVLRGTIRDQDGDPRRARAFIASRGEQKYYLASSDRRGRYAVKLPAGRYTVFAVAGNDISKPHRVSLDAAPVPRDLRLEHAASSEPRAVRAWVKANAIPLATVDPGRGFADLEPLRAVVGDARIVGMGEATHGTREFFRFKHRMFEFLVERMGFTVFAIEASFPDALALNDYIQTGRGDPALLVRDLGFWTWNTREVLALVEWMRRYNATHARKLELWGFDMQAPESAYYAARRYARRADPRSAAIAKRLGELQVIGERYARTEGSDGDLRDETMAANVAWILEQQPPGTRMMLWAHNGHIHASDFDATLPMGWHLRRRFGGDYLAVGFSFNGGRILARGTGDGRRIGEHDVPPSDGKTIDAAFASASLPRFAIDLRRATGDAAAWLSTHQRQRSAGALFNAANEESYYRDLRPRESFDAMVYIDKSTPSQELPSKATGPGTGKPIALPANLSFEEGDAIIPHWTVGPASLRGGYRATLIREGCASGRCVEMTRLEERESDKGFGALAQRIDARPYRGRKIRLRARIRSRITGPNAMAQIWLRVDLPELRVGFFDNMMRRPVRSQPEWTQLEITGRVARDAEAIAYGLLFIGEGTAWIDDVELELVK